MQPDEERDRGDSGREKSEYAASEKPERFGVSFKGPGENKTTKDEEGDDRPHTVGKPVQDREGDSVSTGWVGVGK